MKVTLIGYMGCGKTSIGKILSEKLKFFFYDLDSMIVQKKKDSIYNIFKKNGETFFRKIEHLILKKFLKKHKQYILSVGGGTPCYYNNIYLLNKYSKTFYLKTNIYTLYKRLYIEKKNRPIISHLSKNELFIFIMKHFSNRIFFYEKSSKIIDITGKSKKKIIKEIINYIE
ncbi:shikimate kinase [Blattabacterium punctulatus]|uniref:Shikimate kinase n=1 Tax=Blattabacterium punctulatus TaxID=164514 RepID=A0ABN5M299_9FLAO|nr:shikimate kinase [Blattabacterium punctulatus]AWU39936.1 shikimate kinase [Blattabacterium punctulatus]AWU40480.1 shikimate kinase [Blattabacterium punctulatus]AWU44936.1 shikimate kinase [Blattabacterium punctulatus]